MTAGHRVMWLAMRYWSWRIWIVLMLRQDLWDKWKASQRQRFPSPHNQDTEGEKPWGYRSPHVDEVCGKWRDVLPQLRQRWKLTLLSCRCRNITCGRRKGRVRYMEACDLHPLSCMVKFVTLGFQMVSLQHVFLGITRQYHSCMYISYCFHSQANSVSRSCWVTPTAVSDYLVVSRNVPFGMGDDCII